MTPEERREFDEMQAEQRRLHGDLDKLDLRFAALRKPPEQSAPPAPEIPPLQTPPVPAPAPAVRETRPVQPPAAFVPPSLPEPPPIPQAPLGLAAAKLP